MPRQVTGASPSAPRPPAPPVPPEDQPLSADEIWTRQVVTVVAGAAAGATVGYWAFDHAFSRGMTARERSDLGKFGVALAVLAVATQFGLEEWFTVEGAGTKVDELVLGQKAK